MEKKDQRTDLLFNLTSADAAATANAQPTQYISDYETTGPSNDRPTKWLAGGTTSKSLERLRRSVNFSPTHSQAIISIFVFEWPLGLFRRISCYLRPVVKSRVEVNFIESTGLLTSGSLRQATPDYFGVRYHIALTPTRTCDAAPNP